MFPTNSECLIGISDAFSDFCLLGICHLAHAHCTPNKSVPTLHYTRRPGPIYTGHACRHLPSAVPWISEDRLLTPLLVDSQMTFPSPRSRQLLTTDQKCRQWLLNFDALTSYLSDP